MLTAHQRIDQRLRDAVVVEDGNTEINDCYYEVTFLGATLWSSGGSYPATKKAAEKFASEFRKKLTKLVHGA